MSIIVVDVSSKSKAGAQTVGLKKLTPIKPGKYILKQKFSDGYGKENYSQTKDNHAMAIDSCGMVEEDEVPTKVHGKLSYELIIIKLLYHICLHFA